MQLRREDMVQRGHVYAIVDEIDSILIDEARTPLIISGPAESAGKNAGNVNTAPPIAFFSPCLQWLECCTARCAPSPS